MKKQIAFSVIGVLAAALITVIVIFIFNINAANKEIDEKNNTIAGLETDLSASQAEATDLTSRLTASEAEVVTLEGNVADLEAQNIQLDTDLQAANSQITSLDITNSWLTSELKTIKYPKHFTSVAELTSWLVKDNTNTSYSTASEAQICYILQVKALQSGYILPAFVLPSGSTFYYFNFAIIGGNLYLIDPSSDDVALLDNGLPVLTTYPVTPP
jgi:uncharacterized protein YoxC